MEVSKQTGLPVTELSDHPVSEKGSKPKSYGNHSVAVKNVTHVDLAMGVDAATYQNVWQEAHKLYSNAPTRVDYERGAYRVIGRATIVTNRGAARVQRSVDRYVFRLLPHTQIDGMEIIYGGAKLIDRLSLSHSPELVKGGTLSSRAVIDTLMAKRKFSKSMAEGMSAVFEHGLDRCDMSSLFLIGSLIEHQFDDMARADLHPAVDQAPDGAITHVHLNPAPADLDANVLLGAGAIESGRYCIEDRRLSQVDKRVMRLISAGCQSVHSPADDYRHFLEFVRTPTVLWTLWADEPIGPDPEIGNLTAEDIRTSLVRLALVLDAKADYVRGLTRAQTILRGIRLPQAAPPEDAEGPEDPDQEPPNRNPMWLTGVFELDTVTVSGGRDSNFLWRILELVHAKPDEKFYAEEFARIGSLTAAEKAYCGVIVAGVISSGASVVLHSLNVTGSVLNSWNRVEDDGNRDSTSLLQALFSIPADTDPNVGNIAFFSMIVGAVHQYTTFRLHPESLSSSSFCRNGSRLTEWGEGVLWDSLYHDEIPYIVDVISFMWAWTNWPDVWGITAPAGHFDISDELQFSGAAHEQGVEMRYGDKAYEQRALSVRPYEYVPYGGFVYNVIHQHYRLAEPVPIRFGRILKLGSGIREQVDEEVTPMVQNYMPTIFSLIPGRLLTYNWDRRAVLAPRLMAEDMPDGLWTALSGGGKVMSPNTGIRTMDMQTTQNIQTGAAALHGLVRGYNAGSGDKSARENTEQRAEN